MSSKAAQYDKDTASSAFSLSPIEGAAPHEAKKLCRTLNGIDRRNPINNNALPMKTPRFLLRGFRRPREVASVALGSLERQVLEETWRLGEASVRDVFTALAETFAYTTIMTTLDRLYKKGLLRRQKRGRAFFYSPVVTREELEQGIREDLIEGLLGRGAQAVEPVLACIVDAISDHDRELLDELDRLIRDKRRELRLKS